MLYNYYIRKNNFRVFSARKNIFTTKKENYSISVLVNNFMLDRTASSSAMYFSVSFDGSIVTISVDKSTRSHLDVLASLEDKRPRLREADGCR